MGNTLEEDAMPVLAQGTYCRLLLLQLEQITPRKHTWGSTVQHSNTCRSGILAHQEIWQGHCQEGLQSASGQKTLGALAKASGISSNVSLKSTTFLGNPSSQRP